MAAASASHVCLICDGVLPAAREICPHCRASVAWQDLIAAVRFAQSQFRAWGNQGIGGAHLAAIQAVHERWSEEYCRSAKESQALPTETNLLPIDGCWSCRTPLVNAPSYCNSCGVPVDDPMAQELRYWHYTCGLVKAHYEAGRLPLSQAHACMNDAKARIAALRRNLERDRRFVVATVVQGPASVKTAERESPAEAWPHARAAASVPWAQPGAKATAGSSDKASSAPSRPLWEILLDPRSIQWLLGVGGTLLVVGLVIWLATLGVFKNPAVVAVALGLGNAALLGCGWAVTTSTRYQTAGRALTLLACLVMPLNLWFYHSHQLITLDGHLWVAALVCCVLYAASAMVLRDPVFVYVLCGGVAMTALLMLADMGKFWEIAAPATLLVGLGLMCVHVERAFPEVEGPFGRRRFGLAFFWSGHALLAAGLLLLLGAQVAGGWLYRPLFEPVYRLWDAGPPVIVTERWGQLLALALVLAATYAYTYSDLVVRRVGVYIYLAVFALLWAEVLVVDLFSLTVTTEAAIIALALTALAANLAPAAAARWGYGFSGAADGSPFAPTRPLVRAAQPLGLFLSTLPVVLGVILHLRATYKPLQLAWPLPGGELYAIGGTFVAAMLLTAVACRLGAHLYRHTLPWLSTIYFFGTAAATLVGAAGLLSLVGARTWDVLAPILMVIPILYLVAARLYRGHTPEKPLVWTAQTAAAAILVLVVAASAHLTPQHVFEPEVGSRMNLALALVFAEAAGFYALAAVFRKQGINVYFCTASACGAAWQLLQYAEVGAEYYTLTFAAVGLVLLVGYRLAMWERTRLAEPAFQCANALMSLSFAAAALMTLSRLATRLADVHWSLVMLLGALAALSLLAAWLVRHSGWRRWYVVMAIVEAALMFIALHVLSQLTVWQKLEIFSVAVGIALLAVGHIGWYREQERYDDVVTFNLLMGSLLVGMPLALAVLYYRGQPHFSTLDELGMLTAGIVLLASGCVFQLRATTLTGATLLVLYLLTLVLFINMLETVQTAAIWMTIGGAVIFGTGVLLSVYRDRLLALPDRVKRREGVFRVLSWR